MRVLIVDDEAPARERLQRLLEELGTAQVVGEAANGREALAQVRATGPEVVLLDIRMPGMDGLEAAQHLAGFDPSPAVIFVTAYGEHALAAFEANAIDYLLKPVRRERLAQALEKAAKLSRVQLDALPQEGARTHLSSRLHGNVTLIPLEEVLFFRAEQKYVTVRHRGGEALIEDSLKQLEAEFGDAFVRVHRNALVARRALAGLEKSPDGAQIRLRGCDETVEVSRRHLPEVRRLLKTMSVN